MGKRKGISWASTGKGLREICLKYGIDPGEELIRMAMEEVPTPDGRRVPLLAAEMGPREGYKLKAQILMSLHEYMRPKLRNTETHGTQETIFNIKITQFGALGNSQEKVVELAKPKTLPDGDNSGH